MKYPRQNQEGFSALEILLVLLLIVLVGAAGFFVYNSNRTPASQQPTTKSKKTPKFTTTDTECFSIAVPSSYAVTSTSDTCQYSAKLGSDKDNPEASAIILPYTTPKANLQEAEAALLEVFEDIKKADGQTKVGGNDAVYISENITVGGHRQYSSDYVVLTSKIYTPTGTDYSTNAFRVMVATPENDPEAAHKIIDSIVWK